MTKVGSFRRATDILLGARGERPGNASSPWRGDDRRRPTTQPSPTSPLEPEAIPLTRRIEPILLQPKIVSPPPEPTSGPSTQQTKRLSTLASNPDIPFAIFWILTKKAIDENDNELLYALSINPLVHTFHDELNQANWRNPPLPAHPDPLQYAAIVLADLQKMSGTGETSYLLTKYDCNELFVLLKAVMVLRSQDPVIEDSTDSSKLKEEIAGTIRRYSTKEQESVCQRLEEIAKDTQRLSPGLSSSLHQLAAIGLPRTPS